MAGADQNASEPVVATANAADAQPHPDLEMARVAFERGDYASVRRLAEPVASHPDHPAAAEAADLLRRIRVDPAQVGIVAACFIFFLFIVWRYVL